MLNMDMEGKVALVTGASGGIGLATARPFAQAGAVLSARHTDLIDDDRGPAHEILVKDWSRQISASTRSALAGSRHP